MIRDGQEFFRQAGGIENSALKVVTGALDYSQDGCDRDCLESGFELFGRAEGVSRAVYEQRWASDLRKVLSSLVRLTRRMEWVRQQQQTCGATWFLRCEHAGLAASIGNSAGVDRTTGETSHCVQRFKETFAVPGRVPRPRRTLRPGLPERKIAAQHSESVGGEHFGDDAKKRRPGIRARAMHRHESGDGFPIRPVQIAAYTTLPKGLHLFHVTGTRLAAAGRKARAGVNRTKHLT